jgi:glycine/D-amino acid oxidase-like deaminating enzyme
VPTSRAVPPDADIVIVGGGIVGLSAALWAARLGARTVVLEQDDFTVGATSRNIGVMLYGGLLDRAELLDDLCRDEHIAGRPSAVGHLSLLDSPRYVAAVEREARSPSGTVELLSLAQCETLLDTSIPGQYLAGRWARNGMVVDPVQFALGLAEAAARRGAQLFAGQKATRVSSGRGAVAIEAGGRTVRCRAVVIAAACGATELVPGLAAVLRSHTGHVWRTEPVPPSFGPAMAVNFGDIYWRQLTDGTILIGGGGALGWTEPGNWRCGSPITAFFRESFPLLPEILPAGHWSGVMACTPDDQPMIGPLPRMLGVWLATGFGGHGLPPALYASKLVVHMALGVAAPVADGAAPWRYAPERFAQLSAESLAL